MKIEHTPGLIVEWTPEELRKIRMYKHEAQMSGRPPNRVINWNLDDKRRKWDSNTYEVQRLILSLKANELKQRFHEIWRDLQNAE